MNNKIDPLILKIKLINLCEEQGFIEKDPLAPLKLNAGMWYNYKIIYQVFLSSLGVLI